MEGQIKIRVEYITFFVFVLFLFIVGLGANNGITGFSIKETQDEWILEFTSEEAGYLSLEMIEGTGYGSSDDVEFVELRCKDSSIIPNILTNKIIYENYKCRGKTEIKFIVNKEGRFEQKITFKEKTGIFSVKK